MRDIDDESFNRTMLGIAIGVMSIIPLIIGIKADDWTLVIIGISGITLSIYLAKKGIDYSKKQ